MQSKERLRRHLASSSSQYMVRYLSPKSRGFFSSGTCFRRFSEYGRAFVSTSTPPRHGDFATNIRATETAAEWLEGFWVDAALYAGARSTV